MKKSDEQTVNAGVAHSVGSENPQRVSASLARSSWFSAKAFILWPDLKYVLASRLQSCCKCSEDRKLTDLETAVAEARAAAEVGLDSLSSHEHGLPQLTILSSK